MAGDESELLHLSTRQAPHRLGLAATDSPHSRVCQSPTDDQRQATRCPTSGRLTFRNQGVKLSGTPTRPENARPRQSPTWRRPSPADKPLRRAGHCPSGFRRSSLETLGDLVALGGRSAARHQVAVVQVDAAGTGFGAIGSQLVRGLDWALGGTG